MSRELDELYYYRCELLTRHLRYASPETGYIFTEFSNPEQLAWAGRFNAIGSAADLHIEELRWLKTKQYVQDYTRYWMLCPGAQPRSYGFAACWAAWSVGLVHGDQELAMSLLEKYVRNFAAWEKGLVEYPHDHGYDAKMGLFWNTGRDMGGEVNLASCQLSEVLRGIPGYKIRGGAGFRPDVNAVLYAEADAISKTAASAGHAELAASFQQRAQALRRNTLTQLWDPQREFFLHRWKYDEYSEGDVAGHKSIRAGSLLWETNGDRFGGIGYQRQETGAGKGRELTGFIPWRYGLPEDNPEDDPATGYARAWRFLASENYFKTAYGPTTAELHDPWFHVIYNNCCHNGQSWPFHTARILNASANLLNQYQHHQHFTRADYLDLFSKYVKVQHKDGRPYLAEAHHPFNAEWVMDHWPGIHYFHSSFLDLVITGLVGLRPRNDDVLEVNPLAAEDWEYFALDDVLYRGHRLAIAWDREGRRYGLGAGLHILVDGRLVASSPKMKRLTINMVAQKSPTTPYEMDYAANTEGAEFPRASASYTTKGDAVMAPLNGLCWFDTDYVARWTTRAVWTTSDWYEVDFGAERRIEAVRLGIYADEHGVSVPETISLEYWDGQGWQSVLNPLATPVTPAAHRANTIRFGPVLTARIRVVFKHQPGEGVGLAQLQALAFAPSP
jgi:hypothetical protein